MPPTLAQAFKVYFSRRWSVALLSTAAALYLATLIGLAIRGGASVAFHSPLFPVLLGLPAMLASLWVVSTAKWQFAHPRARLTPGFARAHVAAAAFWLVLPLLIYPLSLSWLLKAPTLAIMAYPLVVGGLYVWGMHTNQVLFQLLGFALFYAPMAPQTAPFWTDTAPTLQAAQGGMIVAGALAVAAWLWRLPHLTEESDHYRIPAHAQSGKASRIEKSEARRNLARHLNREGIFPRISDRWHDRLAHHQASSTAQRQRLLRYGFGAAPIAVLSLTMLLFLLLSTGFNSAISGRANLVALWIPGVIALFIGAAAVSSRLAMRRPRMQTELLLPLSRADWINGLFWACVRDNVVFTVVTGGALLAASLLVQALPAVTIGQALTFAAALLAALVAAFATSMQVGLITSGLKRTLILILGLYAVFLTGGCSIGLSFWIGPIFGLLLAVVLLAVGLLLLRRAHRNWLNAELG